MRSHIINLKSITMKTNEFNSQFFSPVSTSEQMEIQGGFVIIGLICAAIVGAAAAQIFSDWDNFKAGLKGAPEIKE
jgi:hypothetical protein